MFDFQPVNDVRCELGEGPVYDDERDVLWYCDIVGRTIHGAGLAEATHRSHTFDDLVCSIGLCRSGRLVVALRDTVGLFDPDTGIFEALGRIEADDSRTRLNDGKVGPDGAFWVGTMDDSGRKPRERIGALYRVDPSGRIDKKVDGLAVSNGLAFSADGAAMFHTDTGGPWIDRWRFDASTGAIDGRTRIAEPGDDIGRPDGGATDSDGSYWSAGISAARLNRFSPEGDLIESHELPVGAPTMPCFGGPGLKRLFVTSLRAGRPAELLERYPLTGIVIASDSPVAGAPVGRFADVT